MVFYKRIVMAIITATTAKAIIAIIGLSSIAVVVVTAVITGSVS